MTLSPPSPPYRVVALYCFARVPAPQALRAALDGLCREEGLRGTLLVAGEGVNGTLAGGEAGVARLVSFVEDQPGFTGMEVKYGRADAMPFHRLKVRLKREIVTMGVDALDPAREAGTHVAPAAWNALIADPATVVVDTRNTYETALGTFEGAEDPGTERFRDFPRWAEDNRERLAGRRVAMFCTGGIRCEKATAYLKSIGVGEVFHLKGGILNYLQTVPEAESLWRGECFVFDERVSVGHGLAPGAATLCRACRHPLTPAERASALYREGVSCPHCHGERSEADRARYAERQRQVEIAAGRGAPAHIGTR